MEKESLANERQYTNTNFVLNPIDFKSVTNACPSIYGTNGLKETSTEYS
jgi:hypothetical protein